MTMVAPAATGVVLVLAVLGIVLNLAAPTTDQNRVAQMIYDADPVWFGVVGGFLITRRPRNVTCQALWLLAFMIVLSTVSQGVLNDHAAGARLPAALVGWAAWLENTTWMIWFLAVFELCLHFPDGRLPGRFWRVLEPLARVDAAVCVIVCAAVQSDDDYPGVRMPVNLGPLSRIPPGAVNAVIGITFVVMIALWGVTAIGIGLRFRRAHGVERAQLKWLLFAVGTAFAVLSLLIVLEGLYGGRSQMPAWLSDGGDVVTQASLLGLPLGLPLAVAVAVARYGLFEIDRIVSRTVSYLVIVALLAVAYVGVVAGVSALVPDRYGSVSVVLATLAVSALFVPVRRRVIGVVDRRFNRGRYDASLVVAQFAERVRGRAGTGTTGEDLVAAAHRVLQPAHASVWLASPGGRP